MGQRNRTVGLLVGIAASMAGLATVAPGTANARSAAPALFELGPAGPSSRTVAEATRRIDVDTSLLQPGVSQTVSMDLFGSSQTLVLEPTRSGVDGWATWTGAIVGDPDATTTVIRKGADVAAMIATSSGSFRIRSTGPGTQVLQRIGNGFIEAPHDAIRPPTAPPADQAPDALPTGPSAESDPAAGADVPDHPVIDVLIGYTPSALAKAGSLSAMNGEAALAISISNTAYESSGVNGRLRLVGVVSVPEDWDLSTASLNELTAPTDGHADGIHAQRNATGADLVSVLVSDPSSCGLGWRLEGIGSTDSERPWGFSIVDYACAVDNFSFPHELGHNMGLNHDRYADGSSDPGHFPYAYGYVSLDGGWRTIMAYVDECTAEGVTCPRLGRFSNPDQTYGGAPLGVPAGAAEAADNRKALNISQAFVATYRSKPAPFTSWTRFVAQQYRDFLGRAPTASESTVTTNALNTGATTPDGYIDGLLGGSFGTAYAPVARLYFAYFLRPPDIGGLDYWVRKFRAGTKLTAISSNFATSSEFTNKYGPLTNRAFVEKVYENLFDRTGDAGGVAYWTGKLDKKAMTRGQVMVSFSESSEFKRVRAEEIDVVLLYRSLLQRSAGPDFATQVARRQSGTTRRRLILELLDSAEYAGRITA